MPSTPADGPAARTENQEDGGGSTSSRSKNAFDMLMAPKPKPKSPPKHSYASTSMRHIAHGADGLGVYLLHPETFPSHRVVSYSPDFVVVNDRYPKSSVHLLLLPRSPAYSAQHPFDALQDPAFLSSVRGEVEKLRDLVARELQRRFGAESKSEARRQAVLDGEAEPEEGEEGEELPPGRDWKAEVIAGIHARPSMNHLHIHVLSREMHSSCLKHRKHYNSFNTPFLVDVADFPLAADDPRLHPGREQYLRKDLTCWRCGRNFGNRFKALKEHLEDEFEAWKQE
ncbi:related to HNT3 Member of the third branch of the histidine triad (HIT) superfamily of nucleotide-binding proteins [Cephalotrichum gorgonifer]|uniref:Aprataxin-like protein n=1 Tax=Cephalotrichum gorgonifer TaxID=2041049 RepID=A0AAE8MU34_9PEZI|nr:related to HNT3 Member of the third branch of the histidine triad (HIT) superfamily of nucleotide-binding proteins [Cephalotrichum gorgonifer]